MADQPCTVDSPAVQAFLKLLRWLENYPRDDDGVYSAMFGGSSFSDTKTHPNTPNTRWGKTSTAAGAYQIVYGTWNAARRNGVVSDFTPTSQNKVAWWIITTSHAKDLVCGGEPTLRAAFSKLGSQWSSLPGAAQSQVSMEEANARYARYLANYSSTFERGAPR
ncbi:MAG: hypothetical protein ACRYG8_18885 [Janthinobacterium lividum]